MTRSDACDAHLHIFDPAYPSAIPTPLAAGVPEYRCVQARLGLRRAVVVQPRHYGTDNTVLLTAIAALGMAQTRGVAVVQPTVSDDELDRMHAQGVRGIRFSLAAHAPTAKPYAPNRAIVTIDMLEPLARRVHELGWHVQVHFTADQIVEHADLLRRLPSPLVFDHMARLPNHCPTEHPAFHAVRDLLARGRAWVKLSGAYLCSRCGAAETWRDVAPIATAFIACAPERLVWGSDWPHVTELPEAPDAASLLALLDCWTGAEAIRRAILIDNPALLYGFDSPAIPPQSVELTAR